MAIWVSVLLAVTMLTKNAKIKQTSLVTIAARILCKMQWLCPYVDMFSDIFQNKTFSNSTQFNKSRTVKQFSLLIIPISKRSWIWKRGIPQLPPIEKIIAIMNIIDEWQLKLNVTMIIKVLHYSWYLSSRRKTHFCFPTSPILRQCFQCICWMELLAALRPCRSKVVVGYAWSKTNNNGFLM